VERRSRGVRPCSRVVQKMAVTVEGPGETGSAVDDFARAGARRMLATAVEAEVAAYVDAHAGEVDEDGHRLVVRNGSHDEREVLTSAGAIRVRQPRVNDKRVDEASGQRRRFASAILPAWARRSPKVSEVLPLLYLHGLSTSDFAPALEQFVGSAAGLSPLAVTRLTAQWQGGAGVLRAEPGRRGLRVRVGRRRVRQRPVGPGPGLSPRHDRGEE